MKQYFILLILMLLGIQLPAQIIVTIAGNGTGAYSGDGGSATAAELFVPEGILQDSVGNIFIADHANNRVRKISSRGIISTVAGNGTAGFSGDGGAATAAELNSPFGVAIDFAGNMYIADRINNRIRKIDPSGVITTFAGTGASSGATGDGGPATAAVISTPIAIATDSIGNVFISNYGNNTIRKVNFSGIITKVAGTGATGGGYSADGGAATASNISEPRGITFHNGMMYFAEAGNSGIRTVNSSGIIGTAAGNHLTGFAGDGGPATAAKLYAPTDVTFDNIGNMYIADQGNYRIRKVDLSGTINTYAGISEGFSGDGGPATAANLSTAISVKTNYLGELLVSDDDNNRIRSICPPLDSIIGIDTICTGRPVTFTDSSVGGKWSSSDTTIAVVDAASGIATVRTPGTTTIFYSVPYHCGLYVATHRLTVAAASFPGSIIGAGRVCIGDTLWLTDTSAAAPGTWSSSSSTLTTVSSTGRVIGLATGIDTISYTVSNYCGTNTAIKIVAVGTPVIGGTIGGPEAMCPGDTATITCTITGGSWYCTNTTLATINSSGTLTALLPGNDTVLYVLSSLCGSDTAMLAFTVNSPSLCHTGIANVPFEPLSLRIAPNPNNGTFTCSFSANNDENVQLRVTNLLGETVKSYTLPVNHGKMQNISIQLNNPPGIYFLTLTTDDGLLTSKIVKW